MMARSSWLPAGLELAVGLTVGLAVAGSRALARVGSRRMQALADSMRMQAPGLATPADSS